MYQHARTLGRPTALRIASSPEAHKAPLTAARRRRGDVSAIWAIEARRTAVVPLMAWTAACGFPSPADDYMDKPLDFNELLIENLSATFCVRFRGDSMIGAGIFDGDIGVVNRAREAVDGSIIIGVLDGEFTTKRYRRQGNRHWLHAENPRYADIELTEDREFTIWGVVWRSIRIL